jgi:hypothetical protein
MASLLNFIKLKKKSTPMFLKLIHRTESKGTLPNSFHEARITVLPKPDQDTTKKRKL